VFSVSRSVLPPTDRPAPDWLVDEQFEERLVGVLKSGKEAEVFLVERRSSSASCLLAHKRFRPRHPGKGELRELGFSKGTIYRHDAVYRQGWHLNARDRRAVMTKTDHGQDIRSRLWPANELAMLRRAWSAGASVPYPVDRTDDGVLMEYIGSAAMAAPRIVDARLAGGELTDAWRQLVESVGRLAREGVVHADLSVYNVLWWERRVVLIDFPQAVDAATNADAPGLLHRDLLNVGTWFGRRGVDVDVEAAFAEMVMELL
jgi:RIO kinase 1